MELLRKLCAIPQNIADSFKNMRQQSSKVQLIVEPIYLCYQAKIETSKITIESTSRKKKQTSCQETQTEAILQQKELTHQNEEQVPIVHEIQLERKPSSKSEKKLKKQQSKISDPEQESLNSDKTEPSQYSYCQNHFLTVLEKNEQQYKLEQNLLYKQAKRKTSKDYQSDLFRKYIHKIKEHYNEEKQNLKTRTQSSDEKQADSPSDEKNQLIV